MTEQLLWLDLETTGLDFYEDAIIEVAWRCSTLDLTRTSPLYSRVVHTTKYALDRLDNNKFVYDMHEESGLLSDLMREDPQAWTLDRIEDEILRDMNYFDKTATWHLAGASVHFDRRFIDNNMSRLSEKLHHRILDTSSVKLFLEGAGIGVLEDVNPSPHRARYDVTEVFEFLRSARGAILPTETGCTDAQR